MLINKILTPDIETQNYKEADLNKEKCRKGRIAGYLNFAHLKALGSVDEKTPAINLLKHRGSQRHKEKQQLF